MAILPLTKSCISNADTSTGIQRWLFGRIGPEAWQDWYVCCRRAVNNQKKSDGEILVVCDVWQPGWIEPEAAVQERAVKQLDGHYVLIKEGHDTLSQMLVAIAWARENNCDLQVIASPSHYLRVAVHLQIWRWRGETKGVEIDQIVGWGLPRPLEALTDLLLNLITPTIDVIGQRSWWISRLRQQRRTI